MTGQHAAVITLSMYDKGVKIWEFIQFVIFFTSFLIHSDLSTPPTPAGQSRCLACNSASSCSTRCKSMATYSCCSLTFTTNKNSQWHHTRIIWLYKNMMKCHSQFIYGIYQLSIKPISGGATQLLLRYTVNACLRLAASSCDSCSSVGPSLPPWSSWASLPLWAATLVTSSSSRGISSGRGLLRNIPHGMYCKWKTDGNFRNVGCTMIGTSKKCFDFWPTSLLIAFFFYKSCKRWSSYIIHFVSFCGHSKTWHCTIFQAEITLLWWVCCSINGIIQQVVNIACSHVLDFCVFCALVFEELPLLTHVSKGFKR